MSETEDINPMEVYAMELESILESILDVDGDWGWLPRAVARGENRETVQQLRDLCDDMLQNGEWVW